MFTPVLLASALFSLPVHTTELPEQPQQRDPCQQLRIELATVTMQKQTLEHKLKQIEAANAEVMNIIQLQKDLKQLQTNLRQAEKSLNDQIAENRALNEQIVDLTKTLDKQKTAESRSTPSSSGNTTTTVPPQNPTPFRTGWKVVKETMLDGTINKIEHGTLLKTTDGDVFEVSEFRIDIVILINPEVTVVTDGVNYKLIVDGVDGVVLCNRVRGEGIGVGVYFESKIDGNFDGFEFGKLYKLQNGQVWEQTSYKISVRYRFAPTVFVWQSGSQWKMRIDGDDRTVSVKQIN
jgi:hypothetical protein